MHLPQCPFGQGELPEWFRVYMKSREKEYEMEEARQDLLESDLRDQLK